MAKVLALMNAHALAHVSRLLEIAKVLRGRDNVVMFGGHGKYLGIAAKEGLRGRWCWPEDSSCSASALIEGNRPSCREAHLRHRGLRRKPQPQQDKNSLMRLYLPFMKDLISSQKLSRANQKSPERSGSRARLVSAGQ